MDRLMTEHYETNQMYISDGGSHRGSSIEAGNADERVAERAMQDGCLFGDGGSRRAEVMARHGESMVG
jgi:hypothetical protein